MTAVTVSPIQNALDSLRRGARGLEVFHAGDALALKGVLAWAWHAVAALAIGGAIGAEERGQLLLLLAAYNRLLRLTAQPALDPAMVLRALPPLRQLLELLVDRAWPEAARLGEAINTCRAAAKLP